MKTCDPVNPTPPSTLTLAPLKELATVIAIVFGVFVRLKVPAVALPVEAVTVYGPPTVPLALTAVVASPAAFVVADAVLMLAPVPGPVKPTMAPGTGLFAESLTVTESAVAKAAFTMALCTDPEFTRTVAAGPTVTVSVLVPLLAPKPPLPL